MSGEPQFADYAARRDKSRSRVPKGLASLHQAQRHPTEVTARFATGDIVEAPLANIYFRANDFQERTVADPFMGGGSP